MNRIDTVKFLFEMQNEDFARELYARWDRFFALNFERVADEVLAQREIPGKQIEIHHLELDLGTLTEENFDEQFSRILKERLEDALVACLYGEDEKTAVSCLSDEEQAFLLLRYFLLHGSLPWNAEQRHKNISKLFLSVLQANPKQLTDFLRHYGHYTSLQERLVYQLADSELEQGIRLLTTAESTFICSYVRMLKSRYRHLKKSALTETGHRHAVWKVVYAYVLTNRSSYFNKKTFIADTILQLSARYNTSYASLLKMLVSGKEAFAETLAAPPELLLILSELEEEMNQKEVRNIFLDVTKFYQHVSAMLKKGLQADSDVITKEMLITVLANVDSCKSFVTLLEEEEIIRLVPIVAPAESELVINYARSLDKQKDRGRLQGKAGEEFTKLKWIIIFPLLLERKGTAFNQKYFVAKVLRKITAHYNLSVMELLEYFMQQQDLFRLNAVLFQLLTALYEEARQQQAVSHAPPNTKIHLREKIQSEKELTDREKQQLIRILNGNLAERYAFISQLKEEELHGIINYFIPEEKEFIVNYAAALDRQPQHGALQGKAGREFKYLKWVFIFNVITRWGGSEFSRLYFVAGVLRKIAAHYNLKYAELLFYFRAETERLQLPKQLDEVLGILFEKEKQDMVSQLAHIAQKDDHRHLLETLYPAEKGFLISLIQTLEQFRRMAWANVSEQDFKRKSWELIFSLLMESNGKAFDKKLFAAEMIKKLATFYYREAKEIYAWLHQAIEKDKNALSPELKEIVERMHDARNEKTEIPEETPDTHSYIDNAGIALLLPYLPRLFSLLELTEAGTFKDRDAQVRAMFLIQYIVFEKTEFPEYEMTLNKILTGFKTGIPIPHELELTEKEKETALTMMKSIMKHWEKLKNTSIAGLREGFLQRQGKLEVEDDFYILTVEEKSYDMLLDTVPWGFKTIKYTWMDKTLRVRWR
ncbi:hypothetical protein EZS27_005568 [termite gut metagenome]|uniref:Uncharacterized protein n=1 Tax=termite gut metagenome TaxID=433724 RepID=A0A5J4SL36_9ZZZZ